LLRSAGDYRTLNNTAGEIMGQIHIEKGDLTTYATDAIVNAANNDLILGGGLAGAIAGKGGPTIQEECTRHGPIKVGQAAITGAGDLPAKYVIHAASMALGGTTTAQSLADSLRAVLDLAEQYKLKSIALPAIGTGIARFPIDRCAEIMLRIVHDHLSRQPSLNSVYFVLIDDGAYEAFVTAYAGVQGTY